MITSGRSAANASQKIGFWGLSVIECTFLFQVVIRLCFVAKKAKQQPIFRLEQRCAVEVLSGFLGRRVSTGRFHSVGCSSFIIIVSGAVAAEPCHICSRHCCFRLYPSTMMMSRRSSCHHCCCHRKYYTGVPVGSSQVASFGWSFMFRCCGLSFVALRSRLSV